MSLEDKLKWAAKEDKVDFVKDLLKDQTEPTNYKSALSNAIFHCRKEIIQILLSKGNYEEKLPGLALIAHSVTGNLQAVKTLIKQGADLRTFNDLALRESSLHGHTQITKALLKAYEKADLEEFCDLEKKDYPISDIKAEVQFRQKQKTANQSRKNEPEIEP